MSIRLYLAASYSRKQEMRAAAEKLEAAGFEITSSWIKEPHDPLVKLTQFTDADLRNFALTALGDVDACDAVVFFTEHPDAQPPRGGRHVELGYAIADGKRVFLIGPRENVFHYLPGVRAFESVEEFISRVPGMR